MQTSRSQYRHNSTSKHRRTMRGVKIVWTKEWDEYLKKKFPFHNNDYCLRGLKRKGYDGGFDRMCRHARKDLKLKKDPEWRREESRRCVQICMEKRGEDFAERQRQRALNNPNWWGGKHNNGNHLPREVRVELCRKHFHNEEARKKANNTRRKIIARDTRRVQLGLEQLTGVLNIGNALTHAQKVQRYAMKYDCGYVIFRGDHRIYYNENTRRSEARERTAEPVLVRSANPKPDA